MSCLFDKVTFIGMGLIGSSLARVLKNNNLCNKIIAVTRNPETKDKILSLNLADEVFFEAKEAVKDSDIVIIATPVSSIIKIIPDIEGFMKKGAILTDVGSVKGSIASIKVSNNIHFIPAHPIAGTEKSGPENGFAELFENRWCIITPLDRKDNEYKNSLDLVCEMWKIAGMRVEIMDPKRHDMVMALMSHLPHLIAYTIVGTAADLEENSGHDVLKYAAGGFRDFTRIAGSDPVMWRDIFFNNTEAVLECCQRFNEDLTMLQKAIRYKDSDSLLKWFERTRQIRREVVEYGQAQPENEKILLKGKKVN
ncbi:MAG: prephenate dehydrogenase/arogenate dehydrogenase family protein [Alphaproteobacteria bacterium]|nr:prephenate dehydrogenase/arogenate dehydrogenase family protein [Alphaproteobacteria bacterium]